VQILLALAVRFWWVLLIGAIAIGGLIFREYLSGAAADLQVGDCIDLPAEATEVKEVQHRPCAEAHDAEVFLVVDHVAADSAAYPNEEQRLEFVSDRCLPAFASYTGQTFETDQQHDIGWFFPTASGWTDGDREFTCYVIDIGGAKLTGSLRAPAASP
jgi:hypothetical protein